MTPVYTPVYFIGGPEDGETHKVDVSRESVWFAEKADWNIDSDDPTRPVEFISHRYAILFYESKNRWNNGVYYGFHWSLQSDDAKFHELKRRGLA